MILQAHHLTHRFEHLLYEDLTFSLRAGQSMAILGVSGSGKSSILNHLSTMLPPTSGTISLLAYPDIYSLSAHELLAIRRRDLGIIFQAHYLFRGFSTQENLAIAALLTDHPIDPALLRALQIEHLLSQSVGSLSGGQQQRVSIARVLSKKPKIIFADEPTGNLDDYSSDLIWSLLKSANQQLGITIVVVTHRIPERLGIAHRKLNIQEGEVYEYS